MPHRAGQIVVLCLVLLGVVSSTTTCYYNTGNVDHDGHPCEPDAVKNGGHSACCHANDVCWSDGSCSTYGGNIPYIMSCTANTWGDSACPDIQCEGQGKCRVPKTRLQTLTPLDFLHRSNRCRNVDGHLLCTQRDIMLSTWLDYVLHGLRQHVFRLLTWPRRRHS